MKKSQRVTTSVETSADAAEGAVDTPYVDSQVAAALEGSTVEFVVEITE